MVYCLVVLNFCKLMQCFLVEALDGPVAHRDGADGAVGLEGVLVPVEANPFHTAAFAIHGEAGQVLQQLTAVAAAALLGDDKQILQIQALATHECREVVEKQGEADNGAVGFFGKNDLGRMLDEERVVQRRHIGHHLVGAAFVFCQPHNKVQHERCFFLPCRTDRKRSVHTDYQ